MNKREWYTLETKKECTFEWECFMQQICHTISRPDQSNDHGELQEGSNKFQLCNLEGSLGLISYSIGPGDWVLLLLLLPRSPTWGDGGSDMLAGREVSGPSPPPPSFGHDQRQSQQRNEWMNAERRRLNSHANTPLGKEGKHQMPVLKKAQCWWRILGIKKSTRRSKYMN
jgi:hypothetical protein